MELRGFEPLHIPAEIAAELRRMFFGGVTHAVRVLRICVAVLRDVPVLAACACGCLLPGTAVGACTKCFDEDLIPTS